MRLLVLAIFLILTNGAWADQKMSAYTTAQPALTDTDVYISDPTGTPANKKGTVASHFLAAGMTVDGTNVGIGSTTPRGRLDTGNGAIYGDGSHLSGVSGISGLTTNYIPIASSSTNIANGTIFDNGNIGIGTITPGGRIDAVGIGTITSSADIMLLRNASGTNIVQVEDRGRITLNSSYLADGIGTQGLNIIGKLAAGNTFLSNAAQFNLFNTSINTSSAQIGINESVTQSGSGNISGISLSVSQNGGSSSAATGISSNTSGSGSGSVTGLTASSSKSGTGNGNPIYGGDFSSTYSAGSGTQTNMYGISDTSVISSGGNVTNAYGFVNFGPSLSGTADNFYGAYFNDATSGATNNYALVADGQTFITNGNLGIGSSAPQAKLTVIGTGTSTANSFSVRDSSFVQKFLVVDNGNVGIGTANPTGGFVVGSGIGIQAVGIGTTVPQQLCIKSNRQLGTFDGAWNSTCN